MKRHMKDTALATHLPMCTQNPQCATHGVYSLNLEAFRDHFQDTMVVVVLWAPFRVEDFELGHEDF